MQLLNIKSCELHVNVSEYSSVFIFSCPLSPRDNCSHEQPIIEPPYSLFYILLILLEQILFSSVYTHVHSDLTQVHNFRHHMPKTQKYTYPSSDLPKISLYPCAFLGI